MKQATILYILIFIAISGCAYAQQQTKVDPFWTYFIEIYSGQHDVKSPTAQASVVLAAGSTKTSLSRSNRRYPFNGTFANGTTFTRNLDFAFKAQPKMILSLQGVNQLAASGDVSYGFSCQITSINTTRFQTTHQIYGAEVTLLTYMFIAIQTDSSAYYYDSISMFKTQAGTEEFTTVRSFYTIQRNYANSVTFDNFGVNKIQAKGFLAGYKLKQKTAGIKLNFTITPYTSTQYTITVQVGGDMILQKIWFYLIAYDRTAMEQLNPRNHFQDGYTFTLKDSQNEPHPFYYEWDRQTPTRWNYRNFLMGTNSINIDYVDGQTKYFLQYLFLQTYPVNDALVYTYPAANADYLFGITFLNQFADCTRNPYIFGGYQYTAHPRPYGFPANVTLPDGTVVPVTGIDKTTQNTTYYDATQLKCVDVCLKTTFQDQVNQACVPCHESCFTCDAGYSATACLSCLPNRLHNETQKTCTIPKDSQCKQFRTQNTKQVCQTCNLGYWLDYETNQCVFLLQHCEYGINGKCIRCVANHNLVYGGCYPKQQECLLSDVTSDDCLLCKEGYMKSGKLCKKIEIIQIQITSQPVVPTQQSKIKGCKTQNIFGLCDVCKEGFTPNQRHNYCISPKPTDDVLAYPQRVEWILEGREWIQMDKNCQYHRGYNLRCVNCKQGYYLYLSNQNSDHLLCYKQ